MLPDISFQFSATNSANTKRSAMSTGYAAYLYDLPCMQLFPLDMETQQRLDLKTPHVTYQTYFQGEPDIKKGDLLVINDVEYPVKYVAVWPWIDGTTRMHVVVEDLRN